jgi:parallel beta-helix repeat protein
MTRKTDASILVAILIAGIFAIGVQTPLIQGQGVTLVVDDDGLSQFCLDQYNGGLEADSSTINGAIDQAAEGDTIIVCPGNYPENVVIDVEDLTLLGFGCGETVIVGDGTDDAVSVDADGATIGHFEITGGINGIGSDPAQSIDFAMVKHNCIHGNSADGINFFEGSDNIFRSNEVFENADEGIFVGDSTSTSDRNWIGNNNVHDNGANGITMQVTSSADNEINQNDIRDNGPTHWGIDVESDILVKKNKVISNRGGILAQGDRNTFLHNTSNENEQEGFRTLATASMNTFEKNTAKGNEQGFRDQGTMNTFIDNVSRKNTIQGFFVEGTDGVFTSNKVRNNAGDGFEATVASSGNTFDSNKSNQNGDAVGEFGYDDDSVGGGTLGTDNTYTGNKCNSNFDGGSDPSGLCTPQL